MGHTQQHLRTSATSSNANADLRDQAMVAPVDEWPELPEGQLYAGGAVVGSSWSDVERVEEEM